MNKILLSETKYLELIQQITSFCKEFLNEEYEMLSIKVIDKLSKKYKMNGKINIWAAAIIYSLGQINFLFDKSLKTNIEKSAICNYFNVKIDTVSQKAKSIRNILNMHYYDKNFSTEYMKKTKPFDNIRFNDKNITYPNKDLLDFRINAQIFLKNI